LIYPVFLLCKASARVPLSQECYTICLPLISSDEPNLKKHRKFQETQKLKSLV